MKMTARTLLLSTLLLSSTSLAKTTVTFWHTYNTDSTENKVLTTVVIPGFEKKNPDIDVVAQQIPYADFRQKMLTSVAGETGPDLARIDIIWTPEFAQLGALEKVDGMPGFKSLKSQVFPGPLSTNVFDGGYYGVPLDTNTQVLVWNGDLLKQNGISKPPTTLKQFKTPCKNCKRKTATKSPSTVLQFLDPSTGFCCPGSGPGRGNHRRQSHQSQRVPQLSQNRGCSANPLRLVQSRSDCSHHRRVNGPWSSWEGLGGNRYVGTQDGPWA